ncbi:MAG TPA: aromatic amino acid lyase [Solirubrobacteraceae bacterium]|nr:aromatic amino acid lyase [Solirubrobacteraceae bacterium]
MTVEIDGASLSLEQVIRVARGGETVAVSPAAIERMGESRRSVERVLARDDAVYGMTTGLGQHKRHRLAAPDVPQFNRRLLENHLIGHGPPVADEVVRATMLRLANGFAKGTVGVRPVLAERLVEALNAAQHPPVRVLGSAGEADLGPLADLAHGVFGDLELEAKEGLALVNNNSFSTALAALAVADARTLVDSVTVAGALDLEAFGANLSILDPVVGESRPYPGLQAELAGLRRALEGSSLWEPGMARNLQDPLSYRSIAQVGGAARDALAFVESQLAIELNAHHDNPIVTPDADRIISAGNYEALPVAAALDFLRIALAPLVTASLERAMKLLQTPLSGLPGGLSEQEGLLYGGLGAISWSAHALTAEARLLAQPVSFELATTTPEEGIGDRITMAPLAARRLAEQTQLGQRIVAIELLCAAQAVDLRAPNPLGALTGQAYAHVRRLIPFAGAETPYPHDLEPLVALVRSGSVALGA